MKVDRNSRILPAGSCARGWQIRGVGLLKLKHVCSLVASVSLVCTSGIAMMACDEGAPAGIASVPSDVPDTAGIPDDGPIILREVSTTETRDSEEDTEYVITEGGPGWPCDVNGDCDSDWCVPTAEGKKCSELCVENCKVQGWGCKPVETLGDPVQICVPLFDKLCNPCNVEGDCSGFGDTDAACIERNAETGSFCGGDCSTGAKCPEGYQCETLELPGIGEVKQCTPTAEFCTCSPTAIAQELSTTCTFTNEIGVCVGARTCAPDGLTGCSATTPTDEVCDGLDNDCDGITDEEDATGCDEFYKDLDSDGYGTDDPPKCLCAPGPSYKAPTAGDCDDAVANLNPGEPELCDEVDNNCDGETDETDALGCKDYWADVDDDNWGDPEDGKCLCVPDDIYNATKSDDCDDDDEVVFPGAPESCSGKDQNCDGKVGPENTPGCLNYYLDTDKDTFGVAGDFRCLCAPDAPYSTLEAGDCNDENNEIKPGVAESCDTVDNDCDGVTDPADSAGCTTWLKDGDKDNYGGDDEAVCLCVAEPPFNTIVGGDCDDENDKISPVGEEKCNGVDDNCDGETDEIDAGGCKTYYKDEDGDGYGTEDESKCLCTQVAPFDAEVIGDCDDLLDTISPDDQEICGNGIDDNCNGATDEEGGANCVIYFLDSDKDGFGVTGQQKCLCAPSAPFTATKGGDCSDNLIDVNTDAAEECGDLIDNNCNSQTDEEDAIGCSPHFLDGDKDGAGVDGSERCLCGPEGQHIALVDGDCKDTNDKIKPGATEVCNVEDDDCNGTIDDEGATGCEVIFLDVDGDTFGVPGSGKCLCGVQGDYKASKAGDCDDGDLLVFPGEDCTEPSCSGFTVTNPVVCSGEGACDLGGGMAPCPGGYICENDDVCKTACLGDNDCITGNFCVNGICTGKKLDGSPCLDAGQCQSDHCANGFCCGSGDCCGGANSQCNDENVCTNDVCDATTFECTSEANTAQCQTAFCDGDVYTSAKICNGGGCTDGGTPSTCESSDPCLEASCTLGGCALKNSAAGGACTDPSCTDGLITASKLCDGSGGCAVGGSTSACPGGYACLSGSACAAACDNNDGCRGGFYCADTLCLPEKGSGDSCGDDTQCSSGHCSNGFCCASGNCCAKNNDCDDTNECTSDTCLPSFQCANPANTIQCETGSCAGSTYTEPQFCSTGSCSVGGALVQCDTGNVCLFDTCGLGGCGTSPVPIGTPCQQPSCAGFTIANQKTCDGTGGCELGGSIKACAGGYTCETEGDACRTTCESDAQCQPGLFCSGGSCLLKGSDGDPCFGDAQCTSDHCNNGFCCSSGACCSQASDCDDGNVCTTEQCSGQKKCGITFNTLQCEAGACDGLGYTAAKTCKTGVCSEGGTTSDCDKGNPCRNYGCTPTGCTETLALNGTVCEGASCLGSNFTPAHTCNGGQCQNPGAAPCQSGNTCVSGSLCGNGCTDSAQCQNGWYCTGSGNCQPQRDNGDSCSTDDQCSSSHCTNGFCCAAGLCCSKSTDCDDTNVCTNDTCSASFICSNTNNTVQCETGSCDGLTFTSPTNCSLGSCTVGGSQQDCSGNNSCKSYSCTAAGCLADNQPAGLQCAAPSCTAFILTTASTCNSSGSCSQGGTSSSCAGGYSCLDSSTCRSSCTDNGHCAPGSYCGSGVCQPKRVNGDSCLGLDQCASGYCANGYCCNGPTGDCCAEDFHCNDSNSCTTDQCGNQFGCTYSANTDQCASASCDGLSHTAETYCQSSDCTDGGTVSDCSGSNPCKIYGCSTVGCSQGDVDAGIQCAGQTCTGFNLTQALTCNGNGSCSGGGTVAACPGGLTCADANNCRSTCGNNTHCQADFFCASGLCQAKRDNGDSCTTANQCGSDYCGAGFCCTDNGTGVTCCGGASAQCDDGNECTDDSCGGGFACVNTNNTGAVCQDASCNVKTFTFAKTCFDGACIAGGSQSTCQPDSACRRFPCVVASSPGDPQGCVVVDEPLGVPCGSGSCTGSTLTASSACDGSGTCVTGGSSGPCPGGFICADASNCRTTCVTDDDCQSGLVCQDGISCVAKKPNGQQCTAGSDCLSNYCNSGFCCDSGVCCQVPGDCSDSEVCTNDVCSNNQCSNPANTATCEPANCDGLTYSAPKICGGGTCPATGTEDACAGPNTCKVYGCSESLGCTSEDAASGTQCATASCVGSTLTQAATCNGAGSCLTPSNAACPGSLRCATATACLSVCGSNADCVSGNYCADGACLTKKAKGSTCSDSGQCLSDYCNSGICCDSGQCCASSLGCDDGNPCTTNLCSNNQCTVQFDNGETCQDTSCSNLTFTAELKCLAGACTNGGATSDCSGTNPCIVYGCGGSGCTTVDASAGSQCAPSTCADGTLTSTTTCDGAGSCASGGGTAPCTGGLECLNATSCRSSCTNDTHCRDDFYCAGGSCVEKKDNGIACAASNQCSSEFCGNGYCCASGQCCASSSDCGDGNQCTTDQCQNNQCAWVNNSVTCGTGECNGLIHTSANTCSGGTCSGGGASQDCSGTDPCKTYGCQINGCVVGNQSSGVQCQAAGCSGSSLTTAQQCNGQGLCNQGGVTGPCPGNFQCANSTTCHNQCTADGDCVDGFFCDGGACLAQRADGQVCSAATECLSDYCNGGFCCAGGQCCTSSAQCGDGNTCTTDSCNGNMCTWTNNSKICAASSCSGLTWTAQTFCAGGTCSSGGTTQDCSGSNECLTYSCGNVAGCGNAPKDSGTVCDAATCVGTLFTPASVCNGNGTCVDSSNQECDDADVCTGTETCSTSLGCVDGNPATEWVCNDGTCNASCEDASSCAADCTCEPEYALEVGEVDSWATNAAGSTNRIDTYSCSASNYPGNEYTYSFVAPRTGTLEVALIGVDSQTDILILSGSGGSCDPGACIAQVVGGGAAASFSTVAGSTYYFAVDRRALGAVSFQIQTRYTDACATTFAESWERTNFPRAWTSTDNWQIAQDTPFGQWHAKFNGTPTLTTFDRALTSPVFNTSTCGPQITVNFLWRFTEVAPATASTNVEFVAEISTNGSTWTEVFNYDSINGSTAAQVSESFLTSTGAAAASVQIRFVVKGPTTSHVNRFQLEDISISAGP
ncbi:MAG: hypothetical protein ACI9OJ_000132 [Myxococcota bacterium]|jgi:hypothetical protein